MTAPPSLYDWNAAAPGAVPPPGVAVNDETLRDGLQSPSAVDPSTDTKLRLLHLMVDLGIDAVTAGFPATGQRMGAQCRILAREVAEQRLPIAVNCVARCLPEDIAPIARLQQDAGIRLEVGAFIGTSAPRLIAEGWTPDFLRARVDEAVRFAVREGLGVMFVAEDATRTEPEILRLVYTTALEAGATRLVLTDTTGHATPAGAAALVRWVREQVVRDAAVGLDWHGHRDRGLALPNALAAAAAGADRVHATALGVGERCGNTEMELLLVNLRLFGRARGDLTKLPLYCRTVSQGMGVRVPATYPVVGRDAFRTATGIHASAILKARAMGAPELAELVYASLPASMFGLEQTIELSPMSGMANVRYWLTTHGYDPADEAVASALLDAAKRADRILTDEECERAVLGVRPLPADVRH